MEYLNDEFITFSINRIRDEIVLIEFELKRELKPEDLLKIKPPDPVKERLSSNIVIISGRGPIWLYGFLIHFYHPVRAIAVFDPRLSGGVVVESHTNSVKVGEVIKIEV